MLGLDRSRRTGPFLAWKVRIFLVGAVLAMAGIYLDERWMTGSAILLLFAGLLLRFLPTTSDVDSESDDDGSRTGH